MKTKSAISIFRKERGLTLDAAADVFGVNRRTLIRWEQSAPPVPIKRIVEIEAITGIPRDELRPDIFQAKAKRKAAAQ